MLALRLPRDADPALMAIGGSARKRVLVEAAGRADGLARLAPVMLVLGLLGLVLAALSRARPPARRLGRAGWRWPERAARWWPPGIGART